jgi:hypothetical protein
VWHESIVAANCCWIRILQSRLTEWCGVAWESKFFRTLGRIDLSSLKWIVLEGVPVSFGRASAILCA